MIPDEADVKDAYERISTLAIALDGGEYCPEGAADFAALLDEVRYALINPGGRRAATLVRALAWRDSLGESLQVERVGG